MHTTDLGSVSFYGILDTGYVPCDKLFEKCQALLIGGAGIIQLRAKKQSHADRIQIIDTIFPLFEETSVPLIINDDLELAKKYPNLGIHIGQDDVALEIARETLGPDRIIGLSTHSPEQAKGAIAKAHLLSYFAVGPVFATQTKPDYIPVGLELVKHVASLQPKLPWFCIGGINRKNLSQVKEAGARAVVAVSDVLCADDTAGAVRAYVDSVEKHLG